MQICHWLCTRVPQNERKTINCIFFILFLIFKINTNTFLDESYLSIIEKEMLQARNSHRHTHINIHTRGHVSVPYKRWLMISGRGSWAEEVQSGSDFTDTSRHEHHLHALKSHTHSKVHTPLTYRKTPLYSFRHVILFLSCYLLYNVFPLLSASSSVSERGGRGGVAESRWAERDSGMLAQRALYTVLGLHVPLWASMGLFLTAAITTNNWTANEDKWYDCSEHPSSQSAI